VGDGVATPEVLGALDAADLVVLCPSNPYVSIDPILELPSVRERVAQKPVVALSPIVGGKAVKGPLGTMIPDLAGVPASAAAIVQHYGGLLSALVVEQGDAADVPLPCLETRTVMGDERDRERLARELLAFAAELP
jgi:LPPG:FO 2-phospho-L-lactate transferase